MLLEQGINPIKKHNTNFLFTTMYLHLHTIHSQDKNIFYI